MLRNIKFSNSLALGTIVPYFSTNEPEGFLICDGRSCAGYEIEDKLGIKNVPDLRGKFTRMIGGNAGSFGVEQEDCIRNIQGSMSLDSYISGYDMFNPSLSVYPNGAIRRGEPCPQWRNWAVQDAFKAGLHSTNILFDASFVVPTGPENRPVNVALNYIIYVGRKN